MNLPARTRSKRRTSGMTVVELMVGAAITSMVLAGMVVGASMLQQQFASSTRYADAQSDQIRALDYIEMDLRRAKSVTVASGATPLTLSLPNYYQTVSGKKQPRLPTKSGTKVQYGSSNVTVTYTLSGTNLIRTEAGVATTIATSVRSFPTPVRTNNPPCVSVTLSFDSKMTRNGAAQSATLSSKTLLRNLN